MLTQVKDLNPGDIFYRIECDGITCYKLLDLDLIRARVMGYYSLGEKLHASEQLISIHCSVYTSWESARGDLILMKESNIKIIQSGIEALRNQKPPVIKEGE